MGHLRRQEIYYTGAIIFYLNQINKSLSLRTLRLHYQSRTNKKVAELLSDNLILKSEICYFKIRVCLISNVLMPSFSMS